MCSATFGDDMWSTRGVGLTRVLAAIRVRAGPTVKLVFESQNQYQKKAAMSSKQAQAAEDARRAAQAKKDALLDELEKDEKKYEFGFRKSRHQSTEKGKNRKERRTVVYNKPPIQISFKNFNLIKQLKIADFCVSM